jgi:transaldolase
MNTKYKSPLHQTVSTTPTDFWNDSCSVEELTYAIEHGAVGATTNPTIVGQVLKKEMHLWDKRIHQMIAENPSWSEVEITWRLIEGMAIKGAGLLKPVFDRENGKKGRLSIQTNPANYRNAPAMADQAEYFNTLAPNMQVKLPVTSAGLQAIEEATYRGVNVNATVSFCVPQALAVGEAIERGLNRRDADGKPTKNMTPVCTIMVGRMDDWVQVLVKRDGIITNPGYPHWAGVACFKRSYQIYNERGYRARLLAAAYRHHMHWSELIGGDVILTIPYGWQMQFNASDIEVKERIQDEVDPKIIAELELKFPDFKRAYDPNGLTPAEFDSFGPVARTLRSFISSYHDLMGMVRDFMLPNPDVR